MTLLIGTDEAGYGPNLGPLIITATLWEVPDDQRRTDLYQLLAPVVQREVPVPGSQALAIADSKQLYRSGTGLGTLERGVLASLMSLDLGCPRWRDVWRAVVPASEDWLDTIPWHAAFDCQIPREVALSEIERLSALLVEKLHAAQISLRQIRCAAVFPELWNELVDRYGGKGETLAQQTLRLVRESLSGFENRSAVIQCDKFGGRNRYARLLHMTFPEYLVEVVHESRALSVYRWGSPSRRLEFRFAAKGEEFLPAALASMVSKYLRELAMLAFNQFWMQRLPGLKPTAGYPLDARRFKNQIGDVQAKLGIADRILWRTK